MQCTGYIEFAVATQVIFIIIGLGESGCFNYFSSITLNDYI